MVYIKSIVMNSFMSYKDQKELKHKFSEKTNAIVGLNGSGKSNFFNAVRFVCDMFENIHAEQRKKLLHEGYGTTTMTGFVEICFDNSDRRFPMETDEVFIRRYIGVKKDEFFLNSKHITKPDVINFLESAGFSRSNPYYIVQQGKVDKLTNMSESSRLELLKEVAGTRVYDEKRTESDKIMRETSAKLREVEHVLSHIENRLNELRVEQEDLIQFEELDRKKRALEYAIYTADYQDVLRKIAELNEKEEESERSFTLSSEVSSLETVLKQKERELKGYSERIQLLSDEQAILSEERKRLRILSAKLESAVHEASEKRQNQTSQSTELKRKLLDLMREIDDTRAKIGTLKPKYLEILDSERGARDRYAKAEQRRQNLYGKQTRTKQFSSKKERDQWIQSEMKNVSKAIADTKAQIAELQTENSLLNEKIIKISKNQDVLQDDILQKESFLTQTEKTLKLKEIQRHDCANERTSCWKKEDELTQKCEQVSNELSNAERKLHACTKRVVWDGIRVIREFARKNRIRGLHGPLIELFECPPQIRSAVEVAGRGSLFHVVVDNDEVASTLLQHLNKERIGRVTFMPLNQLHPRVANLKQTAETRPIIDELEYNPMYEKAIQQVFGRILLCKSLDVACVYSGAEGVTCVTVDGDLVDRKGSMTGGYFDQEASSLEAMSAIKKLRGELSQLQSELEKTKAVALDVDQNFNRIFGEIQKDQTRLSQVRDSLSHLSREQRSLASEKATLEKHLEEKVNMASNSTMSLSNFQQLHDSLSKELQAPFTSTLSSSEADEMRSIDSEIAAMLSELQDKTAERTMIESQKLKLENLLSENLLLQEESLKKELAVISFGDTTQETLGHNEADLKGVSVNLTHANERFDEIEADLSQEKDRMASLETEIDKIRTAFESKQVLAQQESKTRENSLNKRKLLHQKREDSLKKISELGPLPATDEYENLPRKELLRLLQETNGELQHHRPVNKKAGDQFKTFEEQRRLLMDRKHQLDSGAEKIQQLIQTLDQKKAEAIQRTFRGVTLHFKKVFKELVPNGCADLIMLKNPDASSSSSSSSSSSASSSSSSEDRDAVRIWTGIAIKVSFTSDKLDGPDAVLLHQLSGGQKSLVALALIFAIQRCDPAPFYILDEIDAALDPAHRTAVANLISRQAEGPSGESEGDSEVHRVSPPQFIFTSFGEELVEKAQNHYCVSLVESKVSQLNYVKKEEALKVVRKNISEMRAKH